MIYKSAFAAIVSITENFNSAGKKSSLKMPPPRKQITCRRVPCLGKIETECGYGSGLRYFENERYPYCAEVRSFCGKSYAFTKCTANPPISLSRYTTFKGELPSSPKYFAVSMTGLKPNCFKYAAARSTLNVFMPI